VNRIGIFGATECGKTTLAKSISREYWRQQKKPSLILTNFHDPWGSHAWMTTDAEKFNAAVWKRSGCLVVIEDASSTINRDGEFKKFFTCIRHQDHDFIVIGHDGTDLLRPMRQQLTEVFFFLQTPRSIEIWSQDLPGISGLEQATQLQRHEFVHAKNFETAKRLKLKL
jgi:GTPase SAR1 family protein